MTIRTVTHTRTHNIVTYANPFLVCSTCRTPVEAAHSEQACGCGDGGVTLYPCEHENEFESACPTWGPIDGCSCQEQLGHVPHGQRPG